MKRKLILCAFLVGPTTFAQEHYVKLNVGLNPVGDFVSQSKTVAGGVVPTGKGWDAQGIKVDLRTFKSDVELRDNHMRENYFETAKGDDYAFAVLERAHGEDGKFTGTLKLHGASSPIEGTYSMEKGVVIAKFKTKMSAFNIKKANYKGLGAEDEVGVEALVPVTAGAVAKAPSPVTPPPTARTSVAPAKKKRK
jgi:D-alanine-D-alanine ligase-like ATP-grasp enzyme